MLKPGDLIIYRQTKHSTHPTLKAVEVRPAPQGEFYSYEVLKYWVVSSVKANGRVVAMTRRGKYRELHMDDPCLRKAQWWERLFFAHRFPEWPNQPAGEPKQQQAAAI
jgi:hypothetical protein